MVESNSRLRLHRQQRGWSQRELAQRAQLHAPEISMLETGARRLYPRVARRLADALGVAIDDLKLHRDEVLP